MQTNLISSGYLALLVSQDDKLDRIVHCYLAVICGHPAGYLDFFRGMPESNGYHDERQDAAKSLKYQC